MYKLFLFFIGINALTFVYCFGAPCYGTKMPPKNNLFGGLESQSILDKELENNYGNVRSNQGFFLLSYGLADWLALDLKGGLGNIRQHPVGADEIDYSSSFAGGYGFRLRVFDDKKIKAVYGFQHISVHPYSSELNNQNNKAVLDDWQTSFLISYYLGKITPYLGLKAGRVDYIHWVEENRKRKMSSLAHCLGLVTGLDLTLTDKTWLNLEGQFIDGEAISFRYNFAF